MARITTRSLLHVAIIAKIIALAGAADCSQPRKEGDPSGQQIANVLTKGDLSGVCSGNFSPQSNTDITYNYWGMHYTVHRDDGNQDLKNCKEAFHNIIDQCITSSNFWGGEWSHDGFKYTIYNSIYDQIPNNPLAPGDEGGPPAPSSSSAGAAPPAGATVVTETVGGNAIPVTFVPTTFSQYSTLQSTTTITTTTTDDSGALIIVPWVIGIGGIAFIPIGGGPLPPGITPPPIAPVDPDTPNGNNGDQTTDQQSSSSSSSSSSCTKDISAAPPAGTPREGLQVPMWVQKGRTATSENAPQSTSNPPPPQDTNRPTDRNCYQGKVHSPFRSFDEGAVAGPIAEFCNGYANSYDGFPYTLDKNYPLDGKVWLDSDNLVELQIVHACDDPNPKNDLENQCKFAFGAIVWDCDAGSGVKWGGTANWKCMSYKINGVNRGGMTTSWEGNGAS